MGFNFCSSAVVVVVVVPPGCGSLGAILNAVLSVGTVCVWLSQSTNWLLEPVFLTAGTAEKQKQRKNIRFLMFEHAAVFLKSQSVCM